MIHLKSEAEIRVMHECGKRLIESVKELLPAIKPGITTKEIDDEAERLIKKNGAESSFKRVKGYKWTTCVPVNEQAVHTPPSNRVLKEGDLLTVDIGAYYQGFHTDYATSFVVGENKDPKVKKFLEIGKIALEKGISKVKKGAYLGEIAKAIQDEIYGNGYFILKELTGHGIGRDLHEDPYVLNFVDRPINKTYKIEAGLVIAVEVIYSMGTEEIAYERQGEWSIKTEDSSLAACFEKTIAITEKNAFILT